MKINSGSVNVVGGTGTTSNPDAPFVPLVRATVVGEGATGGLNTEVELHLTPEKARRIGLDFIAAANMAWADTGIRIYAKRHGVDGDGIVSSVLALVKVAMENEG